MMSEPTLVARLLLQPILRIEEARDGSMTVAVEENTRAPSRKALSVNGTAEGE
jgi:hypothetical protein